MLTEQEISERIRVFLLETFPALRATSLKDDDPLLEGGAVDSLGLLEIVTFLESEMGVRLADDDVVVENFESIEAITNLAARRLNDSSAMAKG